MANQQRGEVLLFLGGANRTLKLDFNAIASLEKMHDGTPVHLLLDEEKLGMAVLRDGLFCALRSGDPRGTRTLTPEKVGDWLTEEVERFDEILAAFTAAMSASMPAPKEEKRPTTPAAPAAAVPAPVEPLPSATPPSSTPGSTSTS